MKQIKLISCLVILSSQLVFSQWVGFPSADETDGKFLDIAGDVFTTQYNPGKFVIAIPYDATNFSIEIFDGDCGLFDFVDPAIEHFDLVFPPATIPDNQTYTLYLDPDNDTTGTVVEVGPVPGSTFSDNAWVPMVTAHPVNPAAQQVPGHHYFYWLRVTYDGDIVNDPFLCGYKVRIMSDSPTTPAQIGFKGPFSWVSAPINTFADPPMGSPGNSYNGDWHWYIYIPEGLTQIDLSEGDADYQGDASNGGNPADDSTDPAVLVTPDIRYEILDPLGNPLPGMPNTDPSGNVEYEPFTYSPGGIVPSGMYDWHWWGVDAGNTVNFRLDYVTYSIPEPPLPVELASFTAQAMMTGVQLDWRTESEIENLGFLLERKTTDGEYVEIASYKTKDDMLGQGTVSHATDYSYIDNLVETGTTYEYRLGDVDYNGVVTYHSTREVTVEQAPLAKVEEFTVLPAYPNPFNPSTTIRYNIPAVILSGAKNPQIHISIYDITGKLITTLLNSEQSTGWHSITWNGTNQYGDQVPAGVYLSRVATNNQVKTNKLMLLK